MFASDPLPRRQAGRDHGGGIRRSDRRRSPVSSVRCAAFALRNLDAYPSDPCAPQLHSAGGNADEAWRGESLDLQHPSSAFGGQHRSTSASLNSSLAGPGGRLQRGCVNRPCYLRLIVCRSDSSARCDSESQVACQVNARVQEHAAAYLVRRAGVGVAQDAVHRAHWPAKIRTRR